MGNALLDILVTNGEELLQKYGLKANDAILAEEKHCAIYDDLMTNHKVMHIAGGIQNIARGAAYALPPNSVVYTGCIGDDELAEQLNATNEREGLHQVCFVKQGGKTGVCAAIITGRNRSLVTALRAAENFDYSHLHTPEVAPLIDTAKVFYVESYFLTHGIESVVFVAKRALIAGKVFALNLSAPYIPQSFGAQLHQVLPYCDIVIGNECEAEAWASANGLAEETDLHEIAKAIIAVPKLSVSHSRIVIFTRGAESTLLVTSTEPRNAKYFPVEALSEEEIVDTNGAGDAFAGGFLAALVSGKELDECIETGHKLARMCIGQIGAQYQWPKVNIL